MPSTTKKIDVSDVKHIPPIVSMIQEYELVKETLWNIFERFMNEHNSNEYQYCLESLQEYRYVKNDYSIPEGRFVRYLNVSRPKKMVLKKGGIVVEDKGYNLTLKNVVDGEKGPKMFDLRKSSNLIFLKINNNDKLRFACESNM